MSAQWILAIGCSISFGMSGSILDVVVIGGGYAGLCASYYLNHFGLEHLLFERGKIGQGWQSQQWDSFFLNTPNRLNAFPGLSYMGNSPDEFSSGEGFVSSLQYYATKFQLPVSENSEVLAIEKTEDSPYFSVTVAHENDAQRKYFCWRILVATGVSTDTRTPSFASLVPPGITQFHSTEYRNPSQLPEGAVLVVGSGLSGCEIAEELIDAGRKVFLSTSNVGRIPRKYRGKDIVDWLIQCKVLESKEHAPSQLENATREPIVSGVGEMGHTISLQHLARKGVALTGRTMNVEGNVVSFADDLAAHIKYADDCSDQLKRTIDEYIIQNRIIAPIGETDEADLPAGSVLPGLESLELDKDEIKTIIWATGTSWNLNYLRIPVLDYKGQPRHQQGISTVEGVFFLGFPWLKNRKSNYLFGIKDDAGFVCNAIYTSIR
jgi:putative flavoprotein involved in K+ transport